jgi:ATP synthase protein I
MNDQIKTLYRAELLCITVCLLIWSIAPSYRTYAIGFLVGSIVSTINAWTLMMKIKSVSLQGESGGPKRLNAGFISRACMAILAMMVAVKSPEQVSVVFTIIGLFYVQVVTLLMGILFIFKRKS